MQVLVDNRQQPIEIVAWGPGLLLPSFDPECLAVMTFMRMIDRSFIVTECTNPKLAPHGTLPFIKISNTPISGCKNILNFLKSDVDLDSNLNDEQIAASTAFASLLQNTCQDALLNNWFFESENYENSTRGVLINSLSFLARYSVPAAMANNARNRLAKYQVYSSENSSEIYSYARSAYKAFDTLLGDKDFLFGSSPTSLDAIAFGYLILHCIPNISNPKLFTMMTFESPRLVRYLNRIKDLYFSQEIERTPSRLSNSRLFWEDVMGMPRRIISNIKEYFSLQTPEERVNQFYTWLSVVGAISFFGIYVQNIGFLDEDSDED